MLATIGSSYRQTPSPKASFEIEENSRGHQGIETGERYKENGAKADAILLLFIVDTVKTAGLAWVNCNV